ncbi:MAG TPA: hypothetical protein VE571_00625, partial [Solirubrobacteraceae bacterium]|nr:hypothetical protein [Solirubrobacteraceae bacterium]
MSPGGNVVIDAAAVVALLADRSGLGSWVADTLAGLRPAAPRLIHYEAGNSLRRRELAGELDAHGATAAHKALGKLPIQLWPE